MNVDKVHPFGLHSTLLLFANAADWVIHQKSVWHYVDDFILAGESHSNQCATSVVSALQAFHELGVPIEPEYPEPCTGDMPRLSNIPSQKGRQTKPQLLITPSILIQMKGFLNKNLKINSMGCIYNMLFWILAGRRNLHT